MDLSNRRFVRYRPEARQEDMEAVLRTIIRVVVERRQIVEGMIRTSLGMKAVDCLRLTPDSVLDRKACQAISMLQEKIEVPNYLKNLTSKHSTVYHLNLLTLREARMFWNAGFRKIDEPDEWSLSPLMRVSTTCIGNSKFVVWLIANGADVHRQQLMRDHFDLYDTYQPETGNESSSTTALHYVAINLKYLLYDTIFNKIRWESKSYSKVIRALTRHVLTDTLSDGCTCACSTTGCTAYTMMVKPEDRWRDSLSQARPWTIQSLATFAKFLQIDKPSLGRLRTEIIRFKTFYKMGLRHTCCDIKYSIGVQTYLIYKRYDDEETNEILEEQAEQVERLETLLVEFEAKHEELGCTFIEFMNGYWRRRMKEVMREEQPIDHTGITEIGVELRKTESDSASQASDSDISEGSSWSEDSKTFEDYLAQYKEPQVPCTLRSEQGLRSNEPLSNDYI